MVPLMPQSRSCLVCCGRSGAGARGTSFPITQGVTQGCPLSPILFVIFMDSLLRDMYTHAASGVTLEGVAAVFCGQSFADDTVALSGVAGDADHPGLQHIVDAMHAHSRKWLWDANVLKSKLLMLNVPAPERATRAAGGATPFTWGSTPLPVTQTEKYLGVRVSSEGTWAAHLQAKLGAGRQALAAWRPVFRNRRITCRAKLAVLRTHILPTIAYGLEVITPAGPGDQAALADLTGFVHKCLDEVYGIVGRRAWRLRRCVHRDVLYLDSACMTVLDSLQAAHVRFAAKVLPCAPVPGARDDHSLPPPPTAGLTTRLRAALPASHPWRAAVDAAVGGLLPGLAVAAPSAGDVPAGHTLLAVDNHDIALAIHARRLRSLAGAALPGDEPRAAASAARPRRSARLGVGTPDITLRPLARVLRQASAGCLR